MADSDSTRVETFDVEGRLPEGWTAAAGDWRVADGQLTVDATGGDALITFGNPSWQNYEIEATATIDEVAAGWGSVALVFRAGEGGAAPYSCFSLDTPSQRKRDAAFRVVLGPEATETRKSTKAKDNFDVGRSHKLRVVVHGSNIECYSNDQLVLDNAYCVDRDTGLVGLAAQGCKTRFDDVTVRLLPESTKHADKELKPCMVIGHRGASAVAPENTLASLDAAIAAGADGAECDVNASADGMLVVMHDGKVDRTTDGTGKVTELTLAELKKLDAGSWKDPKFAGEPVPTLDELLQRHKSSNCVAVVEIKGQGISQQVVDAIHAADMLDQSMIIAFSDDVVKEFRALEPRLPCAWLAGKELTGTPGQRAQWIAEQARACNAKSVSLHYNMLSEAVISQLHAMGFSVYTWTVNNPAISDALMRWAIDGITTDDPAMVLRQRAAATP